MVPALLGDPLNLNGILKLWFTVGLLQLHSNDINSYLYRYVHLINSAWMTVISPTLWTIQPLIGSSKNGITYTLENIIFFLICRLKDNSYRNKIWRYLHGFQKVSYLGEKENRPETFYFHIPIQFPYYLKTQIFIPLFVLLSRFFFQGAFNETI